MFQNGVLLHGTAKNKRISLGWLYGETDFRDYLWNKMICNHQRSMLETKNFDCQKNINIK